MAIFDKAASSIKAEVDGIVSDANQAINGFLKPKAATGAKIDGAEDLRVILRIPEEYYRDLIISNSEKSSEVSKTEIVVTADKSDPLRAFRDIGGIVFPYTPTISYDNRANYAEQTVLHSNYTQYFYKSSSVGAIRVEGKFTVQNDQEGMVLLATLHVLRALTKMRFGNDPYAGSPPPICRFDAYGTHMLKNVPVSVASFTHNLPDNVDYIAVGNRKSMVPVLSTISMELNVMYSRQEMFDYDVTGWLSGNLTGRGYL